MPNNSSPWSTNTPWRAHRYLRLGPHTYQAVRTQVDIARGDLTAASRGLQQLAALRHHYDNGHKSIDHLWFETAAYLAAAQGDIHHAAHLAHAAELTLGDGESSPFITWTLQQQHGHHPAWLAALEHPLSLDQATQLALTTTNTPPPSRPAPSGAA